MRNSARSPATQRDRPGPSKWLAARDTACGRAEIATGPEPTCTPLLYSERPSILSCFTSSPTALQGCSAASM